MPDDLIPASGESAAGEYTGGDLGLPEEQPETQVDADVPVSPDDSAEAADTHSEEEGQSTAEDNPEAEAGEVTTYSWRDKTYDTVEDLIGGVDQTFKSWEGRMRSMQQTLAEAEATNRKWQEWYDYQEYNAKQTPKEPEEAPKEPWERVDWERVEQIAATKGNSEAWKAATKMAFEEMKKDIAAEVTSVREEVGKPVKEMQAENAYNEWAQNMWFKEVEQVDENGNYLYPELQEKGDQFDPDASRMIISSWLHLKQQAPEYANSPAGIAQAYQNFKHWALVNNYKGPQQKATEAEGAKAVAANVARNKLGQFTKTTKARNEAASGGSSTPTPTGEGKGPSQSMSEAAQRKRIRDAGRTNLTDQDRAARNIFGVL